MKKKNVLIDTENKYYDLEKQTENDLRIVTEELKNEQNKLEKISKELIFSSNTEQDLEILKNSISNIEKTEEYIQNGNVEEAANLLNKTKDNLKILISGLEKQLGKKTSNEFNNINNTIKIAQEKYANAFSKNQSIRTDSIKRQERIKNIDTEIQNWKNLKFNSEKMSKELYERVNKVKIDLENTSKLPEQLAEKKGGLTQNILDTENKKNELSIELTRSEEEYQKINKDLKEIEQKMILARENKARSGATLEGLENRKKDLISTLKNDLNVGEKNLLEKSDLQNIDELPNVIEQEDKLDAKKMREKNLVQ